ncbi:BnaC09g43010D [Brassica napus]|uniref:BnaC09g43010D protein n=2 Tax=Brassica napus TaxID=3708 RepID=A0A078F5W2_BRANA|nr:BnaC09g43010D [Brassica napus]
MEVQRQLDYEESHHDHVVQISSVEASLVKAAKKTCGETPCLFFDANSLSREAGDRKAAMKKLLVAVALCSLFIVVEVIGGIKANSLAILTDAAHLFVDVTAFGISLFSLWASGWEATPRKSYGFFRIEVLGALVSVQMIWLLAGFLVYEAIARLHNGGGEVQGSLMFGISAFGLMVNLAMAFLLGHSHGGHSHGHGHDHENQHDHHHHPQLSEALLEENGTRSEKKRNLNLEGAYLHALGDLIQSVGVMLGGAVIWYKPEWKIIDLICTLLFSVIVLGTTLGMSRNILDVLMESTPQEIDADKLEKGVRPEADGDMVLDKVIDYIKTEYNISHVTIQIERQ